MSQESLFPGTHPSGYWLGVLAREDPLAPTLEIAPNQGIAATVQLRISLGLLPVGFRTIMVGSFDRVTQGFVLAGAWLQLLALLLVLGWFVVRRGPR